MFNSLFIQVQAKGVKKTFEKITTHHNCLARECKTDIMLRLIDPYMFTQKSSQTFNNSFHLSEEKIQKGMLIVD